MGKRKRAIKALLKKNLKDKIGDVVGLRKAIYAKSGEDGDSIGINMEALMESNPNISVDNLFDITMGEATRAIGAKPVPVVDEVGDEIPFIDYDCPTCDETILSSRGVLPYIQNHRVGCNKCDRVWVFNYDAESNDYIITGEQ